LCERVANRFMSRAYGPCPVCDIGQHTSDSTTRGARRNQEPCVGGSRARHRAVWLEERREFSSAESPYPHTSQTTVQGATDLRLGQEDAPARLPLWVLRALPPGSFRSFSAEKPRHTGTTYSHDIQARHTGSPINRRRGNRRLIVFDGSCCPARERYFAAKRVHAARSNVKS
jgi:hypothetical protein